ncbi:MAG: DNA (cytosine-5-)-methyltransferase, partial [Vicinamibacteria bacterium]
AGDITEIPETDIPSHDVLLAGFPCQPFSLAGVSKKNSLDRPHGFEDPTQGTLFFDIKRILAHHRPTAFVLENVKHLLNHDRGRTFRVIRDTLVDLGYELYHKILDAAGLVPQHRERIFLVGFDRPVPFTFPELPIEGPKLAKILELHEEVDQKYTLSDQLWEYLQKYAEKHRKKGNGFGYSLADPSGITRTLSARYQKDGSEILIDQPGKNPRRLTPEECRRLMGFPDRFRFPDDVSDTQRYRQMGNAVVVPVVRRVAERVVEVFNEHYPPLTQPSLFEESERASAA